MAGLLPPFTYSGQVPRKVVLLPPHVVQPPRKLTSLQAYKKLILPRLNRTSLGNGCGRHQFRPNTVDAAGISR